jgi:dipeptidyl-peptidase-4
MDDPKVRLTSVDVTYPLLFARTQGFSLGRPLDFTVSPDGRRVLFLRTRGGEDPVRCLWSFDAGSGTGTLLADPSIIGAVGEEMSRQESTRRERERDRDRSAGIAKYSTDAAVRTAVFVLHGRLFKVDLVSRTVTEVPTATPVADPRLNPPGTTIAYVCDGALRVTDADGKHDRPLAEPDGPEASWGLPEHEAAESMLRHRGYWWSPAGDQLLAARVNNAPVQVWWIADPGDPATAPRAVRYPTAGTANAEVGLWLLGLDGSRIRTAVDDEYVTAVTWDETALLAVTQNRRQTVMRILAIDPTSGATATEHEDTDPAWTTIVPGLPAHTAGGELIWSVDDGETRRLTVGGEPVTPPGLQFFEVLSVDGDTILFSGSSEPTERHLFTWSSDAGLVQLSDSPGLYTGRRAGGTTLIRSSTLNGVVVTVGHHEIVGHATVSPITPRVDLFASGERALPTAVLLPTGYVPGSAKLPVLIDSYGGPAAQRVLASATGNYSSMSYYSSQWYADQGFAVVIADGRGVPGRGPAWERTIDGNRLEVLLEDQIDALYAAADRHPDLDLGRVAIRGWSAGGVLAAVAVLRRPDVFHAAAAGALLTDQFLYSTHWQERFLGLPAEEQAAYERSSLIADAPGLRRPLLLIHGLADDNVFPLHTLRPNVQPEPARH